jgi:hypothetical protein
MSKLFAGIALLPLLLQAPAVADEHLSARTVAEWSGYHYSDGATAGELSVRGACLPPAPALAIRAGSCDEGPAENSASTVDQVLLGFNVVRDMESGSIIAGSAGVTAPALNIAVTLDAPTALSVTATIEDVHGQQAAFAESSAEPSPRNVSSKSITWSVRTAAAGVHRFRVAYRSGSHTLMPSVQVETSARSSDIARYHGGSVPAPPGGGVSQTSVLFMRQRRQPASATPRLDVGRTSAVHVEFGRAAVATVAPSIWADADYVPGTDRPALVRGVWDASAALGHGAASSGITAAWSERSSSFIFDTGFEPRSQNPFWVIGVSDQGKGLTEGDHQRVAVGMHAAAATTFRAGGPSNDLGTLRLTAEQGSPVRSATDFRRAPDLSGRVGDTLAETVVPISSRSITEAMVAVDAAGGDIDNSDGSAPRSSTVVFRPPDGWAFNTAFVGSGGRGSESYGHEVAFVNGDVHFTVTLRPGHFWLETLTMDGIYDYRHVISLGLIASPIGVTRDFVSMRTESFRVPAMVGAYTAEGLRRTFSVGAGAVSLVLSGDNISLRSL